MKVKQLSSGDERSFAVVLDPGEEAVEQLLVFARNHEITAARLTGLGAFERAVLGFFDFGKKNYEEIPLDEQTEVVALIGNFATMDAEAKLHPHAVLSDRTGRAWGGHLLKGWVRPTLEVTVTDEPAHLRRRTDPETGLPLLAP